MNLLRQGEAAGLGLPTGGALHMNQVGDDPERVAVLLLLPVFAPAAKTTNGWLVSARQGALRQADVQPAGEKV